MRQPNIILLMTDQLRGDALGYAVEFLPEQAIFFEMGKKALQNIGFRVALAGFPMTPK